MKMQEISMNAPQKLLLLLGLMLLSSIVSMAQENKTNLISNDTVITPKDTLPAISKTTSSGSKDSLIVKKYSPRVAAIRSAIFPGLGQIYNRKYWKLPIVYAAMGISGGVFLFNLKNYRNTRFAYKVRYNMRVSGTDSALFVKIKDELKPLSEESLRFYRNQFRRDIDLSALVFILLWGLNVVDATVDAHLKSFDVSPNLSLKIRPGHSEMANTNGLSLVLTMGGNKSR